VYPPSAPQTYYTRTLWYGDRLISRERLRELPRFKFLKIERVRVNDGVAEYIEISSDGTYYNVRGIRDAVQNGFGYHCKGLMDLITWLHEHGWDSWI
jgi:hypothetical protein